MDNKCTEARPTFPDPGFPKTSILNPLSWTPSYCSERDAENDALIFSTMVSIVSDTPGRGAEGEDEKGRVRARYRTSFRREVCRAGRRRGIRGRMVERGMLERWVGGAA